MTRNMNAQAWTTAAPRCSQIGAMVEWIKEPPWFDNTTTSITAGSVPFSPSTLVRKKTLLTVHPREKRPVVTHAITDW